MEPGRRSVAQLPGFVTTHPPGAYAPEFGADALTPATQRSSRGATALHVACVRSSSTALHGGGALSAPGGASAGQIPPIQL